MSIWEQKSDIEKTSSTPPQAKPFRRLTLVIGIGLLLLFGLLLSQSRTTYPTQILAAPAASCSDGNFPTSILTDTTLSGDLFVTGNVDVKDGATLTLDPGTRVMMCGLYDIEFNNGALNAIGTAQNPIVFEGETPSTAWDSLFFNGIAGPLPSSTLQHVIIDGGGNGTGDDEAAIRIYAADGTEEPDIVLEDITVRNSAAYGIYVRADESDPTPPLLSSLTITSSAKAPLLFWAAGVGGLGTGNTFSGNGEEVIEVRAGTVLGGRIYNSQTWQKQPIPYRMVRDFGGLSVDADTASDPYPTLTIAPGTQFKMDPDFEILVTKGRLMAEGTATEPIIFEATDPSRPWRRIFFNGVGNEVPTMTLQHLILDGGGGSDPKADDAAVYLYAPDGTVGSGPAMDHITIRNSGSYGLMARVNEQDDTPMAISNLTITGSARAPMYLWGAAVGGLSSDNVLTGNTEDAVFIDGSGLGGSLDHSATWRRQTVPYRLLNQVTVSHARTPILTLDPGVTVEFTSTASIKINGGGLTAEGTATDPITFTRAPGVATWGRIFLEDNIDPASRISHATIEYAGGLNGAVYFRGETLALDNVTIRNATNAGLYTRGTFVTVKDSVFTQNGEGLRFQYGAGGVLRNNVIENNGTGITVLNNSDDVCVDAMGNYWGASNGPADAIAAADACNLTTTNAGGGDDVSEDVLYRPWLSAMPGDGAIDGSQISAEDFWIIADGLKTTTLTVKVRDALGNPLVGKDVSLETTRGVIRQPTSPTDADGITTAIISSTETGPAQVTAFNETDGEPLAALAYLTFWQGQGDQAGLIPPGGAPFASPQLVIEGKPFEQGLPMAFRLPMQNSNAEPVQIEVVYSVSALNVGVRFTPVYTTNTTLQPGERWDAPGTWTPPVTGHHCVRADVIVTLPDGQRLVIRPLQVVDVGPFQVNLKLVPPDPCNSLDPTELIPSYGGLPSVVKHIRKGLVQTYLVKECLAQNLTFGSSSRAGVVQVNSPTAARNYQMIATPAAITMPQLPAGGDLTQAEAEAANAIVDTAGELLAMDIAIETARLRAEQAGDADDAEWVDRQLNAYRDYQRAKATDLRQLVDRIDNYLALTKDVGKPDEIFTPSEYGTYLNELATSGYDAETIAFHQSVGLSAEDIQVQIEAEIDTLETNLFFVTSFYETLMDIRDAAQRRAEELEDNYPTPLARAQAGAQAEGFYLGTLTTDFRVGNPTETQGTVELFIRPVQLPLDWTYILNNTSLDLAPGEVATVTLTLDVGHTIPRDSQARVAVEGYIGSELIGGIVFEQEIPAAGANTVFLPLVTRN